MIQRVFPVVLSLLILISPMPAQAKPLITGSEVTESQLCLQGDAGPSRLVALCKAALKDPGTSAGERANISSALGQAFLDQGDDAAAAGHFREAMRLNPTSTRAINGLGWVRWGEDRYAEAAKLFRRSVDLRPTAQGLAGLASSLWNGSDGDIEEVLGHLDAALAIDPGYRWAMREQGWVHYDAGNYDLALASFDLAAAQYADDWNAQYGRSLVFEEQGEFENSLLAVNEAIRADGSNPWGFAQRAYVLRELDRNAQAIRDADRVIDLRPDAPDGYVQKGLALVALRRRQDALEVFDSGTSRGIEDAVLFYWYADTLGDEGEMDQAQDVVGRAIQANDAVPAYHILSAWIAMKQQAWKTSIEAAEAALALDPDLAFPHYYAAVAIANTGTADAALERFDAAMDAGIGPDMIGTFAADLIAAGRVLSAVKLRRRY